MKSIIIIWIVFIIIERLIFSEETNNEYKCPRNSPLLVKNVENSSNIECVCKPYDENLYSISNEIIKIQWLNKINNLGEVSTWYMGSDISSNGDLIIESFIYTTQASPERFFYGIKSNGRSLFYDSQNDKFINQITILSNTSIPKFEFQFIKIKLINDDKDYYLSSCFDYYSIEIIDFYNNEIYGVSLDKFFNYSEWGTKIYSIIDLENEEKTYMFCFIGKKEENFYLSLQKFQFNNADITQSNSYNKISSTPENDQFIIHNSFQISCFEISKYNIIQCFYLNITGNYTVGLFKENDLEFIYSEIIDESPQGIGDNERLEIFYKSINLKKEVSILAYTLNKQPESIFIQLKNLIYNNRYLKHELEDYLIKFKKIELKIEEVSGIYAYFTLSDLKKINNNKFVLITTPYNLSTTTSYDIYIFIFDIYNFHDTNLFIRYYHIQTQFYNYFLYRFLLCITYDRYLGLIFTTSTTEWIYYQKFTLFSYINSTDSELMLLNSESILRLNNYINNENIENNIFGVDLYGIKILKLPNSNEIGVYFFSTLKNKIIFENDILSPEDEILFVYDYDNLYNGNEIYTIEMAGIVQEKEYSDSLKFTVKNIYYGNTSPELFYKRKIFIGRTSFYNFTIPNSISGNNDNSCKDNCKVCYNSICIKCQSEFKIIEDTNICQTEIPNNYYLNENNSICRKCHENCISCLQGPILSSDVLEIEDTNCGECKENYYRIENTNNCINKNNIPETYYFDSNKDLVCKCFENCKTCNQGRVNSTYYSCLSCDENSILYEKSGNCLNCMAKGKYANHYENECIDFIPDGYYLENEENKALGICYFSCKKCITGGDSNVHNCTECKEGYTYKNKEGTKCLKNCSEEYLYTDEKNKMCYNDCLENIDTERKYNFHNICLSLNEKPEDYELVGENNFIRKCNIEFDYLFNNECYYSCPNNTKFNESSSNPKLCICNNLFYLNNNLQICINNDSCPLEYPYLKPGTAECSKCFYKYNEECYPSCPNNTYVSQIIDNISICEDITDEPKTEIRTEIRTEIITEITTEILTQEYIEIGTQLEINQFFDFSKILDKVEQLDNKNMIVINDYPNITINIYVNGINIENEEINHSFTIINLEECEEKLKSFYNLDLNEYLYIATFENLNNKNNRVTNQTNFKIYLKNGTELKDLSPCNNVPISISSELVDLDLANYDEAEIFHKQGYNIYNLSSEFYTDKCASANINGNDIVIKDRLDIYPYNASFCANGCQLNNVKIESKRVNCSCNISYNEENQEINESQTKIYATENFINYLLDNLNYKIFGCYKILNQIKIRDLLNNIGFYFGIGFILFNTICCLIFSLYYLAQIRIQIYKLIPKQKDLLKKLESNDKTQKLSLFNKSVKGNSNKRIININNTPKSHSKVLFTNNINNITSNIKSKFNKIKETKVKNSEIKIFNSQKELEYDSFKTIEERDYNFLPYSQALKIDKRNFFSIYYSLLKRKIEIISILFYPEDFTHKSLTLCIYVFDFFLSFFMNALLYTDDVVSEKYHNNGQLDLFTTLFLSLTSNIASSIILYFIKKIVSYEDYLSVMVKDIHYKYQYILVFKKLYLVLKIKVSFFFFLNFIISMFITFYLIIFCYIYKKSQGSLIINYIIGFAESLAYSVGVSLIICIFRYLGLKRKLIFIYRTSVYLDEKF